MRAAPWEPQADETPEEFQEFTSWLHSGMSMSAWARETDRNQVTVLARGARRRWTARKAAWVAMLAAEATEAAQDAVRALAVQHAHALSQARTRLLESILDEEGPAISRKDAVALLPKIVEIERLVAGEATARIAGADDLSALSDEDLAKLADLRAKVDKSSDMH